LREADADVEKDEHALEARPARPRLESVGQLELVGDGVSAADAGQRPEEALVADASAEDLDVIQRRYAVASSRCRSGDSSSAKKRKKPSWSGPTWWK
jgi:hypothetical protein